MIAIDRDPTHQRLPQNGSLDFIAKGRCQGSRRAARAAREGDDAARSKRSYLTSAGERSPRRARAALSRSAASTNRARPSKTTAARWSTIPPRSSRSTPRVSCTRPQANGWKRFPYSRARDRARGGRSRSASRALSGRGRGPAQARRSRELRAKLSATRVRSKAERDAAPSVVATAILERLQARPVGAAGGALGGRAMPFISARRRSTPGSTGSRTRSARSSSKPAMIARLSSMYYADQLGRSEDVALLAATARGGEPERRRRRRRRALAERLGRPRRRGPAPRRAAGSGSSSGGGSASSGKIAAAAPASARGEIPAAAVAAAPMEEPAPVDDSAEGRRALVEQARRSRAQGTQERGGGEVPRRSARDRPRARVRTILAFLETYLKQLRKFADLRAMLQGEPQRRTRRSGAAGRLAPRVAGLSEAQLRDADGAIAAYKALLELGLPADESLRVAAEAPARGAETAGTILRYQVLEQEAGARDGHRGAHRPRAQHRQAPRAEAQGT